MAYSIRNANWRIFAAFMLAVAMVMGAYYAARGVGGPKVAKASTDTELLQQIATKDSDGDGLSDWEESLYGTDPHMVDTKNLGMTDGEAVAKGLLVPKAVAQAQVTADTPSANELDLTAPANGSLTDIFAKNFFTLYLAAKQQNNGADLTKDEIAALAQKTIENLVGSVSATPDAYSPNDVPQGSGGVEALTQYAAASEAVFIAHQSHEAKSELDYLQDALKGDTTALEHIKKIATAYRETSIGLAAMTVPPEIRAAHLEFINALAHIGDAEQDFARLDTDPLATMLALSEYKRNTAAMAKSFSDLQTVFTSAHLTLTSDQKGAGYLALVKDLASFYKP